MINEKNVCGIKFFNELDKLLKDKSFVNLATENFVRQTTGQLETSLQRIADGVSDELPAIQ